MWVINCNIGLVGYFLALLNKIKSVSPSQKELLYFVMQVFFWGGGWGGWWKGGTISLF